MQLDRRGGARPYAGGVAGHDERKAGGILISGLAAGKLPIPYNATYAAIRASVNTFSENLCAVSYAAPACTSRCWPCPVRTSHGCLEALVEKRCRTCDLGWTRTARYR